MIPPAGPARCSRPTTTKSMTGLDLALYGQEMDNATAALAKMNLILHDCPTAEIWQDNVLARPHFKQGNGSLKSFDFVVANPPFSFKAWSNGFNPAEDEFKRFEFGIPPAKNGDHAFLLHVLSSLKSTGKAAVNLPHGILFRGGAEAAIRREIVRRGYIKGTSASRRTCSMAPASPPASLCSTRRMPMRGRASFWWMPATVSSKRATRIACAPRTSTRSWTPSSARSKSIPLTPTLSP
jgi:N-6 DNA Methylase